ncbi:hypothetical protein COU57_05105 [Candidatus Pacearchaeota archaeon CG10_big_fil_rev_8_21_14_0_10_32_14]|nr:MAG: hypothetical protein COU57_05105 [Candidatus Pacearchaeota archaeon CG10_big_fil_rev_8_21_14_0_10_32_14]
MENVSAWPYRKLCVGTTDSYTGMLSMDYLIRRTKAWKEVDTYEINGQRQWLQVATVKEKEIGEFLGRLKRELGENPEKNHLYGIQLNASCPSPEVIKLGQGSALVKRPTKVVNLINELLKQDEYKVGIKLRLGLNEEEVRQKKILSTLEELQKIDNPNFTNVTIHFKHARDPSYAAYNYFLLKEIASFKLPLILNGGIKSYADFERITKNIPNRKNIQGYMIARGALENPDCFKDYRRGDGKILPIRKLEDIGKEYEMYCNEHMPKSIYLTKTKKYCSWFPASLEIPETAKDEGKRSFY